MIVVLFGMSLRHFVKTNKETIRCNSFFHDMISAILSIYHTRSKPNIKQTMFTWPVKIAGLLGCLN